MLQIKNLKNFHHNLVRLTVRTFSAEIDYKNAKAFNEIPGPKSFFETAKLIALPTGRYYKKPLSEMMAMMKDDYGTLTTFAGQFGEKTMAVTYLPQDYEKIFRLEGKWPYRRGLDSFTYFRKQHRPDLFQAGGGLSVEQGEEWAEFRTKVNQIMMQPRNAKLYIPGIDDVTMDFISQIKVLRDDKMEMPNDFWEKLNEWALESIALISLDTRLGLFNDKAASEEGRKLNLIIKQVFTLSYEYDILPSIWRWIKTPGFKNAMKVYEEGSEIIFKHIEKAVKKYQENPSNAEHEGVLEKLLKIDKGVAVVMAADMIGAGVDTTSSAVSFVLYCLAKNPEKQNILRDEILKILPNKNSKLDAKSFDNVPYLRAVIKESMRMFPVINSNLRRLNQDIVLQGYQIPKGTDILMVQSTSSKDYFEQPEKFIPERWLKDNNDPKCPHVRDVHPFAFLPFGFGSRMCVGKRFADLEIEVITARLIREFQLSWEHPDLKIKSIILNFPDSPLKFKMVDL